MSNTAFTESQSSDLVERAIAERVLRILNDRTLDRDRRIALVHRAQRELLEHQVEIRRRMAIAKQAATVALPQGWRVQSVQLSEGRVQVGAISHRRGFAWVDAGEAPAGAGKDRRVQDIVRDKARSERRSHQHAANAVAVKRT